MLALIKAATTVIKQNFKVICHIPDKTKSVVYLLLSVLKTGIKVV